MDGQNVSNVNCQNLVSQDLVTELLEIITKFGHLSVIGEAAKWAMDQNPNLSLLPPYLTLLATNGSRGDLRAALAALKAFKEGSDSGWIELLPNDQAENILETLTDYLSRGCREDNLETRQLIVHILAMLPQMAVDALYKQLDSDYMVEIIKEMFDKVDC